MSTSSGPKRSPHFFDREPDGSVRLRMRFDSDEAMLIERAAGDVPLMIWLHRAIHQAALREARGRERERPTLPPPTD